MQLQIEAIFTDRKKPSRKWTQAVADSGSVESVIQTLIELATEEGPAGVVIMTTYNGTALYATADSDVATVQGHYLKARGGGMVGASTR